MGPDVWGEGRGKGNKKKQQSWENPWATGGNQWTDGGSNGGNQERFLKY